MTQPTQGYIFYPMFNSFPRSKIWGKFFSLFFLTIPLFLFAQILFCILALKLLVLLLSSFPYSVVPQVKHVHRLTASELETAADQLDHLRRSQLLEIQGEGQQPTEEGQLGAEAGPQPSLSIIGQSFQKR